MLSLTRRGPGAPWRAWRHVTKIDPDRPLAPGLLEQVLGSGTDALLIGGTQGVTRAKVSALLQRLQGAALPVAVEVSTAEAVVPGADLYLIPSVLNSAHSDWVLGHHARAFARLVAALAPPAGWSLVPWPELVPEAYLVLNGDAAVAELTAARTNLDPTEVAAYAALAGRLWRLPLLYIEYSGVYGDPALVAAARNAAGAAHVFYGGGIDRAERAAAMAAVADTVVVGNALYRHGLDCLAATAAAVHAVPPPGQPAA